MTLHYPIALISCAYIIHNFGNLETYCDWTQKYLLSQNINCTGVTANVIALLSFQCSNNSYWAIGLKFPVEMGSITKILGHWKHQLFSLFSSFFFSRERYANMTISRNKYRIKPFLWVRAFRHSQKTSSILISNRQELGCSKSYKKSNPR